MNTSPEESLTQTESSYNRSSSLTSDNEYDSLETDGKSVNEKNESDCKSDENTSQTKNISELDMKKNGTSCENQTNDPPRNFAFRNANPSGDVSEIFTSNDSLSTTYLNSSSNDNNSKMSVTEVFVNASYAYDSVEKIKELPRREPSSDRAKKNAGKKARNRRASLKPNGVNPNSDVFKISREEMQNLIGDITDYESYLNKHTSMRETLKNQNEKIPIYSLQQSKSIIDSDPVSSVRFNSRRNSDDSLDDGGSTSYESSDVKSQLNDADEKLKSDTVSFDNDESTGCISEERLRKGDEPASLFEQHRQGPGMEYLEELKKSVFNTATYLERCLQKINDKHTIASITSMKYEENANRNDCDRSGVARRPPSTQTNNNLINTESENLEIMQLEEAIKTIHDSIKYSLCKNNESMYKQDLRTLRDKLKYVTIMHSKSSKGSVCAKNNSPEAFDRVVMNNFEDIISHMENENADPADPNRGGDGETQGEPVQEKDTEARGEVAGETHAQTDTKTVDSVYKRDVESARRGSKPKKINYEFKKNQVYRRVARKDSDESRRRSDLRPNSSKCKTEKSKTTRGDVAALHDGQTKRSGVTGAIETGDDSLKKNEHASPQRKAYNVVDLSTVADLIDTANIKYCSSYDKPYSRMKKTHTEKNSTGEAPKGPNGEETTNVVETDENEEATKRRSNDRISTISINDIQKLERAINDPKLIHNDRYTVIPVSYIRKQKPPMNGIDEKPEYEHRPSLRKTDFKNIKTATQSPVKTYIERPKKKTPFISKESYADPSKYPNVTKGKFAQNLEKYNDSTKRTMNILNSKANNNRPPTKAGQRSTSQRNADQIYNFNRRDVSFIKSWQQQPDYRSGRIASNVLRSDKKPQNELSTCSDKKSAKSTAPEHHMRYSNSRNIYRSNESVFYKSKNYIASSSKSSSGNSRVNVNSVTTTQLHDSRKDVENTTLDKKNATRHAPSADKRRENDTNNRIILSSASDIFFGPQRFNNKVCNMKKSPTEQHKKIKNQAGKPDDRSRPARAGEHNDRNKRRPGLSSPQVQMTSVSSNNFRISKRIEDLAKPKKHYVRAHRDQYKNVLGKEFDVRMQKKYFGNTIYSNYLNKMIRTRSLKDLHWLENFVNIKNHFADELQNRCSTVNKSRKNAPMRDLEVNRNMPTVADQKDRLADFHGRKVISRKRSAEGADVEKELKKYIQHWIENNQAAALYASSEGAKDRISAEIYARMKQEIDNISLKRRCGNTLEELLQSVFRTYLAENIIDTNGREVPKLACKDKKSLKSIPSQYYDAQSKFDGQTNERNNDSYRKTNRITVTNVPPKDEQRLKQTSNKPKCFSSNTNEHDSKKSEPYDIKNDKPNRNAEETVDFIIESLLESVDENLDERQTRTKTTDENRNGTSAGERAENVNDLSLSMELINDLEELLNDYSSDEIKSFDTTDTSGSSLKYPSENLTESYGSKFGTDSFDRNGGSSLKVQNVKKERASRPNIRSTITNGVEMESERSEMKSERSGMESELEIAPVRIETAKRLYFRRTVGEMIRSCVTNSYRELEEWNRYESRDVKVEDGLKEPVKSDPDSERIDRVVRTKLENAAGETRIDVPYENKSNPDLRRTDSRDDLCVVLYENNPSLIRDRSPCTTVYSDEFSSSVPKTSRDEFDDSTPAYVTDYNLLLKPLLDKCEKCKIVIEKTESEESIADNIRNVLVELNSIQSRKSKIDLNVPNRRTGTELCERYECPKPKILKMLNPKDRRHLSDDNFIKFSVLLTVYILVYLCVFSCLTVKIHCK